MLNTGAQPNVVQCSVMQSREILERTLAQTALLKKNTFRVPWKIRHIGFPLFTELVGEIEPYKAPLLGYNLLVFRVEFADTCMKTTCSHSNVQAVSLQLIIQL